jgi:predicted metal-dependent hydrolase
MIGRPVDGASRRDGDVASPVPRAGTVLQGGRAKAYRPLPADDRRRAYDAALEAYDRGDFFETHELLEPAWMGTDDLAERALHQGLIKLAAAFVHGVRGNPSGIAKNLVGARERLAEAVGTPAAAGSGLDVAALVAAIDERLARLAADPTDASIEAPTLPRLAR